MRLESHVVHQQHATAAQQAVVACATASRLAERAGPGARRCQGQGEENWLPAPSWLCSTAIVPPISSTSWWR